jgi:hypothetical protein
MSLAKATVVKKGDKEVDEFARVTTAVLLGEGGGCPSPEFNESERGVRVVFDGSVMQPVSF